MRTTKKKHIGSYSEPQTLDDVGLHSMYAWWGILPQEILPKKWPQYGRLVGFYLKEPSGRAQECLADTLLGCPTHALTRRETSTNWI